MISSTGTCFDEGCAAGTQCVEEAVVRRRLDSGEIGQLLDVGAPGRSIQLGDGVGPEGRKNALTQTVGG